MGNCLIARGSSSSSTVWAEEEAQWEWVSKEIMVSATDKTSGGGGQQPLWSSSSSPSDGKVKITISKTQLLQLLRKGDISSNKDSNNHHAAAEELQLLARLLQVDAAAGGGGGDDLAATWWQQRSWRPRLQSIPELN